MCLVSDFSPRGRFQRLSASFQFTHIVMSWDIGDEWPVFVSSKEDIEDWGGVGKITAIKLIKKINKWEKNKNKNENLATAPILESGGPWFWLGVGPIMQTR